MSDNSFFGKIVDGELPAPRAAVTLGAQFVSIEPKLGTIEMTFDGNPEFTNPLGNIQGGFLPAMLLRRV